MFHHVILETVMHMTVKMVVIVIMPVETRNWIVAQNDMFPISNIEFFVMRDFTESFLKLSILQ